MTSLQKQQLKQKIIITLKTLEKEILLQEEKLKPIAPDCSLGCLLREELINAQEVENKALLQLKERQKKLQYALKRVDLPEYGICLDCEDEISLQRLELVPEALYCVDCLNEHQISS